MKIECYGAFPGGDPRDFTPDPECSTEAEREAHRRACAIWDAGAQIGSERPAHAWLADGQGRLVGHVARCKYGLGTYFVEDEEPTPAEGAAAPCPTCTDAGLALTRDGQLDECPTCTPKEN